MAFRSAQVYAVGRMRGVIFDMDGVLIDSEPIHEKVESELFRELGIKISEREHRAYQGTSSIEMWRSVVEGHGLAEDPEALALRQRSRFLRYFGEGAVAQVPGIRQILDGLSGRATKLALATSSVAAVVNDVLSATGLGSYFSVRVTGDEVLRTKPAPDIFLLAARRLGLNPDACVVVEDSENGVAAAKAAGMTCIGFRNHGSGNPELRAADHRVGSAAELEALLGTLL